MSVEHHQGHADRIVLADTNFPSASICGEGADGPRLVKTLCNQKKRDKNAITLHMPQVRADGHSIPVLLEAILQLLPLDTYVYAPV